MGRTFTQVFFTSVMSKKYRDLSILEVHLHQGRKTMFSDLDAELFLNWPRRHCC